MARRAWEGHLGPMTASKTVDDSRERHDAGFLRLTGQRKTHRLELSDSRTRLAAWSFISVHFSPE